METGTIEVNGVRYLIRVHYENRSNSKASIGRKSINIRIPCFLNREERFKQTFLMKQWAIRKLQENPEISGPEVQREYSDGEILKVGNEEYILRICFKDKQDSSARITGNTLCLMISSNLSKVQQNKHISSLISRCIASKRVPHLREKLNELNRKHFSQRINKVFFKHNRSSWGSCSRAGNINISTRLLFAPDDVLEYVCTHELAHLIEPNHSERFWKLVENAMPDYKEKVQWLKENRELCKF